MKYFSCFSGIGGFELGIQYAYDNRPNILNRSEVLGQNSADSKEGENGVTCIGFSEIDKYATQIYQSHFPYEQCKRCSTQNQRQSEVSSSGNQERQPIEQSDNGAKGLTCNCKHKPYGDITKIDTATLPDFDCLVGGFPCQAFSIAGKRRGFEDTRGTLFFELARILRAKQPRLFVFENVKGLLSHDNGKTFSTIIATIDELGYDCQWQVLNSKNHGVPQNRERVFIVGNRKDTGRPSAFPIMSRYGTNNYEKVYSLSETVSSYGRELLLGMAQQEKKEVSRQQMQKLLKETLSGIRKGECGEAENTQENLGGQPEVNIQEIDTLGAFLESADDSGTIHGMVSIPTEDMLILWNNSGKSQENTGLVQQQNSQDDDGQDGLIQRLGTIEHYPLLLAVQPYQGKLFYSLGDGRNWKKIYISKIQTVGQTNLSSILEECPDEKYFLSDKQMEQLMRDTTRAIPRSRVHSRSRYGNGTGSHIKQLNQPRHSNDRVYGADGISPTLNTMQGGNRQPFIQNPKMMNYKKDYENSVAITATSYKEPPVVNAIRRLTPTECERLQGFPDGWTEGVSDTQRYKCLGNAVTVNVIADIFSHL